MIAMVGSPVLLEAIFEGGLGSLSTNAILTRVGIEAGIQTVLNIASYGIEGINRIDIADVILAGSGLNFVGSNFSGASIDWTPFSSSSNFSTIGNGKVLQIQQLT